MVFYAPGVRDSLVTVSVAGQFRSGSGWKALTLRPRRESVRSTRRVLAVHVRGGTVFFLPPALRPLRAEPLAAGLRQNGHARAELASEKQIFIGPQHDEHLVVPAGGALRRTQAMQTALIAWVTKGGAQRLAWRFGEHGERALWGQVVRSERNGR
jgi:hypothetical protein